MVQTSKARITALGAYVPKKRLTNQELETMVETNDEWIVQRTGIRERRIAGSDEFTSDLSIAAVENLMETSGKSVEDVDFIIVATTTPDYPFPSVASRIQAKFGIANAGSVDISATCAGFAYALHMANGLITAGLHKKILVIGAETLSKTTDYTDRTSCILFGDGAGAVLVEWDPENASFLASQVGTFGEGGVHLYRSGLSQKMGDIDLVKTGCIVQNGREVYKWAVTTVPKEMKNLVQKAEMNLTDMDWFVPHSANLRMIESICEKSGFPFERTLYSLEYYGNTSSATIPLSLQIGVQDGKIKNGDTLLLYGFGGGLVHAGVVIKWNPDKR
ncbi:ketoacyl-ACP synthase III [Fodinisporobacter ferrooxydans]|uniref:Beta-ketoacyl-[acyl-carrier-protein] synthase III n=1 Tax=Fodinisporobacter ferrooxydans TaxID=2901836 RepID=A0ABY4CQ12_9BACL|nr:ketoacyl-ACP synthase III [Alicyclobacillaceae bacterium MYW30-H2]